MEKVTMPDTSLSGVPPLRRGNAVMAMARGLALFLGGFTLLNLLGDVRQPGFDANLWWIDTRPLPVTLARMLLLVAGVLLAGYGIRPRMGCWRRRMSLAGVVLLAGLALVNAIQFVLLWRQGVIHPRFPIPLSAIIFAALLMVGWAVHSLRHRGGGRGHRLLLSATLFVCLVGFPLLQLLCFGTTDYRRPADVIVVLGARAYADGRPSHALSDRVRTACRLYQQGLAPRLIFSGGPGDGAVHETESMRRYALSQGVPDAAIALDQGGVDTQATVRNTTAMFRAMHVRRAMVVSHFFHLPRVKMTYQRAGWNVYTVPVSGAVLSRHQQTFCAFRELPALWLYYLRPLWEG